MRDRVYYICPTCLEKALKYVIFDIDGTNLEEGYRCEACGDKFIGLNDSEVLAENPHIND